MTVPVFVFESTRVYRRFRRYRDDFELKLGNAAGAPWAEAARGCLTKADARCADQDLDGAWLHLVAALRQDIPYLRGAALWDREQVIRAETAKVQSAWRSAAIESLLEGPDGVSHKPGHKAKQAEEKKQGQGEDDGGAGGGNGGSDGRQAAGGPPSPTGDAERAERLLHVQELIDDYYQTAYYRISLVKAHYVNLLLVSVTALVALLALIGWSGADIGAWGVWDWKTLLVILLFGVLGAAFSATRKVTDDPSKSKIPDMAANISISISRCLLGATPALAAYAFFKSGLLTVGMIGKSDGAKPDAASMAFLFALAFASGFSERLVLKVLEAMDKPPSPSKPAPKHGRPKP